MKLPRRIIREIEQHERFLLTTHIHPDGDALGSILALGLFLESMGKETVLFTEDPVPAQYSFLPGVEKITHELPSLSDFHASLVVDCGDADRIGKRATEIITIHPTIVLDHHLARHPFGDLRWVDPERAAVGEMIYMLIKEAGKDISYNMAVNIYVAILTDTGSFRYASTSSQSLRIAAEMIDLGVKGSRVSEMVYETFPAGRLRLLCYVLSTLRLYYEGRVALVHVSQEMFTNTATTLEEVESFVNYPLSIAGVRLAIIIKEIGRNRFSVSLRSRDNINSAFIAEKFGGGGHFNASGFQRSGDYDAVKQELLDEIGLILEKRAVVGF